MLKIADRAFSSRLLVGSGKYRSAQVMHDAIAASGSELITFALKRVELEQPQDDLVTPIQQLGLQLLPNTSGAKTAEQAVFAAKLARQALGTDWVKLKFTLTPIIYCRIRSKP